ncbi:hypothetical protein COHCIP112018_02264 [Cohnella sp. JJ-181]|nr:hypothetical protein COHCIP112018_02264 [Cohnella sp. JJ-181]
MGIRIQIVAGLLVGGHLVYERERTDLDLCACFFRDLARDAVDDRLPRLEPAAGKIVMDASLVVFDQQHFAVFDD